MRPTMEVETGNCPPARTTALLQRGQVVWIIAALPAIERLAADAKVTRGMGHVAAATIEIHPG